MLTRNILSEGCKEQDGGAHHATILRAGCARPRTAASIMHSLRIMLSTSPIMGIIGALRMVPGTGELPPPSWLITFPRSRPLAAGRCTTPSLMLPGRSRHSAEVRRSTPTGSSPSTATTLRFRCQRCSRSLYLSTASRGQDRAALRGMIRRAAKNDRWLHPPPPPTCAGSSRLALLVHNGSRRGLNASPAQGSGKLVLQPRLRIAARPPLRYPARRPRSNPGTQSSGRVLGAWVSNGFLGAEAWLRRIGPVRGGCPVVMRRRVPDVDASHVGWGGFPGCRRC